MPFRDIVLDGNATRFLRRLPRMIAVLSWYGRENVVRSLLGLLSQFEHFSAHRPDLLKLYTQKCKRCNDHFIESLNSMISRLRRINHAPLIADLQQAASNVALTHHVR